MTDTWVLYGNDAASVLTDAAGNIMPGRTGYVFSDRLGLTPFTNTCLVNPNESRGPTTGGAISSDSDGKVGFYALNYDQPLYWRQGGVAWRINPASTADVVASRLGTLRADVDSASTRADQALAQLTLNVKSYGAVGDGAANDAASIQTAVNTAATLGLRVHFPDGTYRPTATIDLPDSTYITGAPRATIDLSGLGTSPGLQALGTAATAVLLTADAAEGSRTVALSDVTGIAPGDWVKIGSTTISTSVTSQPIGEIQRVRSVAGNVLTFADPLQRTYLLSANASAQRLTQKANITVEGLSFVGPQSDITTRYQGLRFDTCRNVRVKDCNFRWVHYIAVALVDTIFAKVSGCHFQDALEVGSAYGVACHWATQDVTVTGCTSLRVRHHVTCGGGTSRRGTPRRVTVSACTATESIDAGFDAHSGCDDYTVTGCHVIGGGQDGIIGQGRRMTITGNNVQGVARHGVFIQATSIGGMDCEVTGNKVTACGGRGVLVVADGGTVIHRLWSGATVTGNNVTDCAGTGIELQNLDTTVSAEGGTVTGNSVSRSGNYGILVRGFRGSAVGNNVVQGTPSTFAAIYLLTSPDCTVTGNAVNGLSTSQSGIRLGTTSTGCILNANRVRNCTTGITQDSGSGPAIVTSNNTTGCTNGYTLSGSGNVNVNNL